MQRWASNSHHPRLRTPHRRISTARVLRLSNAAQLVGLQHEFAGVRAGGKTIDSLQLIDCFPPYDSETLQPLVDDASVLAEYKARFIIRASYAETVKGEDDDFWDNTDEAADVLASDLGAYTYAMQVQCPATIAAIVRILEQQDMEEFCDRCSYGGYEIGEACGFTRVSAFLEAWSAASDFPLAWDACVAKELVDAVRQTHESLPVARILNGWVRKLLSSMNSAAPNETLSLALSMLGD
jgi:hypothetical protein